MKQTLLILSIALLIVALVRVIDQNRAHHGVATSKTDTLLIMDTLYVDSISGRQYLPSNVIKLPGLQITAISAVGYFSLSNKFNECESLFVSDSLFPADSQKGFLGIVRRNTWVDEPVRFDPSDGMWECGGRSYFQKFKCNKTLMTFLRDHEGYIREIKIFQTQ